MSALTGQGRAHSIGAGQLAARIGLGLVATAQAEVGVWGLVAPRSFFSDFPGAGRHWVSALGAYNEHLVRDFAAMELGLAVLLAFAVLWFERRLVLAAGASFVVATIPHFIYHLTTTGHFSTSDNVASLGGFVLELVLVAAVMARLLRSPHEPDRSE